MDKLLWCLMAEALEGNLGLEREKVEKWMQDDFDMFVNKIGADEQTSEGENTIQALVSVCNDYQLYGFRKGLDLGIRLMIALEGPPETM